MLAEFPDVLQYIILDYLEPEVKILELEKIGRLTFPTDPEPDLEMQSRLEISEDLAKSIFCRDWELLVKTGTGEDRKETLYICRFDKFREHGEERKHINLLYPELLDEFFSNINIEIKNKRCYNSCDLGENIYIYTNNPVDLLRYRIDNIHFEFYCKECGKQFQNNIFGIRKIGNRNFHILEPDTIMPNAYVGLQVILLKNKQTTFGISRSFIVYKNGMEASGVIYSMDSYDNFELENTYRWIWNTLPKL